MGRRRRAPQDGRGRKERVRDRPARSPDPMEAADCSYQFRIALLGDAAVGKTSLLRCYVAGARGAAAEPEPEPTVGVEFYSRALQLPAGLRVKLQLWDTAGHERFRCGGKGGGSVPDTWGEPRPQVPTAGAQAGIRGPYPTNPFLLNHSFYKAPQPQHVLSLSHIPAPPPPPYPYPSPPPHQSP